MGAPALKTFSIKNDIIELSPQDNIDKFDPEADKKMKSLWSKDSELCTVQVFHTKSWGMLQGKVVGTSLVILDSFALPVRGTETRAGRPEDLVDWYHSHPGNGRWLSGIDVSTRLNDQKHTDPFVAVVVDPNRTMTAGKVDIGAFRMYLEDYTPENVASSEYQSIPLSQIEGFGIHANQYYPLEVQLIEIKSRDAVTGLALELILG
ncbi:COP9 signalosome complex subunit 5 [Lentinula edodes]|nr:COP9 signalosome complex subunit 5 [Lentinula edodes]